jgi:hypothetical protein
MREIVTKKVENVLKQFLSERLPKRFGVESGIATGLQRAAKK